MELYISNEADQSIKSYTTNKMIEFNFSHFPDELKGRYRELNLCLKNEEGQILGGVIGELCWNWLEIEYLFVEESIRAQGYGTKLLVAAETIARDQGYDYVKLDTLSFQALDFYKKLGYKVYGSIENAGREFTHYYLKKDL